MSDRRTWLLLALVLWTGCASSWCGLKGPAGAFERLRAAESVRSSHVDAAGAPTCEWEAFRVLSRSTDDLWFRRLVLEADAPGRLYGLGGLALLAPSRFQEVLPGFLVDSTEVDTVYGCNFNRQTVGEVAEEISQGRWIDSWTVGTRWEGKTPGSVR